MKLTVIGTGNMGKALMKGFIDGNIFKPEEITVYDVIEAARNNAASTFGVNAASDAASSVKDADYVLMAVKPQHFDNALISFLH